MEKYIEKYKIKSFHADQYGQVSISSLFNFMIEAASEHAQKMEWGFDKLQKDKLFWVLSRMYIEVERYPRWQEKIIIKTWPSGTDGMFAHRNFTIESSTGELILRANSCWLILNADTRKIFLLRAYRNTFPRLENSLDCRTPQRIKPPKHQTEISYHPVLYSELDINKHFNSVKYLDRVLNDLGTDFLDKYEPSRIEVNYLKEGMPTDSLGINHLQTDSSESLIGIARESDGIDLFSAKLQWRDRVVCKTNKIEL